MTFEQMKQRVRHFFGVVPAETASPPPEERLTPTAAKRAEPKVTNERTTLGVMLWAVFIGLLFTLLTPIFNCHLVGATTAVLVAFSCLGCGLLVGFLFCIPKQGKLTEANERTASRKEIDSSTTTVDKLAESNTRSDYPYTPQLNTNLIEISDWLCKIIVGIGLIQFQTILGELRTSAQKLSEDLGPGTTYSFAMGLIVYFSVMGFLCGYLATRLYLTGQFVRADREAMSDAKFKEIDDKVDEQGRQIKEEMDRRQKAQLDEMEVNLAAIIGRQAYRSDEPGSAAFNFAVDRLIEVRRSWPDHRRAAMVLSSLFFKSRKYKEAIEVLDDALSAKMSRGTGRDPHAGDMHFNRAAYYYKLFKAAKAADSEVEKRRTKEETTRSVKLAIEFNPAVEQYRLTDPDWMAIAADPEFSHLFPVVPAAPISPVVAPTAPLPPTP